LAGEESAVAGHDCGGRVAHRMALDCPRAVTKLAVLDIVPTRHAFRTTDMQCGLGYWHWFILAQPEPLPKHLLGAGPEGWIRGRLSALRKGRTPFDPAALDVLPRPGGDPRLLHKVEGGSLPCGHYIPEEAPEEPAAALMAFLEVRRRRSPVRTPPMVMATPETSMSTATSPAATV
jgi:pimeloyl-ACP methyl ester carboxylesterase